MTSLKAWWDQIFRMFSQNSEHKKSENEKGFLLVEAAMIWPLIMLVLFFIIYLIFGLYNQVTSLAVINFAAENYDCYQADEMFEKEENHESLVCDFVEQYRHRFLLPHYPIEIHKENSIFEESIIIKQHEKYPLVLLNKIGFEYEHKTSIVKGYILREADFINKTDIFRETP